MSHLPSNWTKGSLSDIRLDSYVGDRFYAGVNILLQVVAPLILTLGLSILSNQSYSIEGRESSLSVFPGFNIGSHHSGWIVLAMFAVWVCVWQGRRWAVLVNIILCGYFLAEAIFNKLGTPYLELASVIYLTLRLSGELGPDLLRKNPEA
jgi:hypothetical protein